MIVQTNLDLFFMPSSNCWHAILIVIKGVKTIISMFEISSNSPFHIIYKWYILHIVYLSYILKAINCFNFQVTIKPIDFSNEIVSWCLQWLFVLTKNWNDCLSYNRTPASFSRDTCFITTETVELYLGLETNNEYW